MRRLTHGQLEVPQEFLDRHQQQVTGGSASPMPRSAARVGSTSSRHIGAAGGIANDAFSPEEEDPQDVVSESMSAVHSVAATRRRFSRVRIQMPSTSSIHSTPPASPGFRHQTGGGGLTPQDLERDAESAMPLRFTLRERQVSRHSLWPATGSLLRPSTDRTPPPGAAASPGIPGSSSQPPAARSSRTSTSSRSFNTRM